MNDLISRSKVIAVLEQLEEHSLTGKMDISNAIYLLENQPTAYNIGKVVAELEQKKEEVQRMRNTCVALSDLEVCDIENVIYERVIEIVKQDGVSDDVCECRLLNGYKFLHETSCDNVFDMERGFKFCPFCGKKIKVVE